jgi:hypothetical protein
MSLFNPSEMDVRSITGVRNTLGKFKQTTPKSHRILNGDKCKLPMYRRALLMQLGYSMNSINYGLLDKKTYRNIRHFYLIFPIV